MKVVLTADARQDLIDIGRYIRCDNPNRARTFVHELVDRCEELGTMARAFPVVPRLAANASENETTRTTSSSIASRMIAVEVLHVVHGARDWERLLFPSK